MNFDNRSLAFNTETTLLILARRADHGGRLWAQDDPGGGHLVLSLPLAERPVAVHV